MSNKFSDWVNADTDLPSLEDLEKKHHHSDDSAGHAKTQETTHAEVVVQKQKTSVYDVLYAMLAGLCAGIIIIALLITVSYLPAFGSKTNPTVNEVYQKYVYEGVEDTGAVNLVAGMILDYRAFDTLGESMMLFTATMGVVMLLRRPKKPSDYNKLEQGGKR